MVEISPQRTTVSVHISLALQHQAARVEYSKVIENDSFVAKMAKSHNPMTDVLPKRYFVPFVIVSVRNSALTTEDPMLT